MKHRRDSYVFRALCTMVLVAVVAVAVPGAAGARTGEAEARTGAAGARTGAAGAQRYAATIRAGRTAAAAMLKQTGATSFSIALVSDGRVVWRQGFGYADKAAATRPGPDTMYGIGSVSKMLATVATMKLVDKGLVSLDEPLVTYVPSFTMLSPGYRNVTVRMLLDHSSGFPGSTYCDALTSEYWPGYLPEVLQTLAGSRLKHTPGLVNVYCNDGFTMVEALVPAVTGESYVQFVQDEILTPLGMTHTAFPVTTFADGSYAKAYDGDTALPREVLNCLAAGGAYSTPTDLGKLATMLSDRGAYHGRRTLSAASVHEMGRDQTLHSFDPAPQQWLRYGLGWDSVAQPGLAAVGVNAWVKGGDTNVYGSGVIVAPQQRLAAAVTGVAPMDAEACETLCESVLLHALIDRGRLHQMPAPAATQAPPALRASAAQLAGIEGDWAGNSTVVRVRPAGADPQVLALDQLDSGSWTTVVKRLRLRADGRFHGAGGPTSFRVVRAGGRSYLVNRHVSGSGHYLDDLVLGQKLRPGAALSSAWRSRTGRYWLAVTGRPDSLVYTYGGTVLALGEVPGLAGSLTVESAFGGLQVVDPGQSDTAGLMFLQIPGVGSRDMNDVVVEVHGGQEWVRYGDTLFRPLDGVQALSAGANTVTFGPEGYAEWRSVAQASRLEMGAGDAWYLYGPDASVLAGGTTLPATVDAPAGSYLVLFGPASSGSSVTMTPAAGAGSARTAPRFAPRLRVLGAPRLQAPSSPDLPGLLK
jgi:CubicO group peptidase (beta-lactamase class C family)